MRLFRKIISTLIVINFKIILINLYKIILTLYNNNDKGKELNIIVIDYYRQSLVYSGVISFLRSYK